MTQGRPKPVEHVSVAFSQTGDNGLDTGSHMLQRIILQVIFMHLKVRRVCKKDYMKVRKSKVEMEYRIVTLLKVVSSKMC